MGVATEGNITVDQASKTVTVEQRQKLAIHADKVVLPFDVIKTLAANIILMELGALPQGSPSAGGVVKS